ncbi:hypothetical protein ACFOTA_11400 [Chitinophaga sp. GCM10012297]|uniref:Uncharacterized protein n=1 Tax=Chitinophaga chungangae TaxID=2821488 RepID=A0ABS3YEC5_9BACT|nr:hypothetical protein [Chitinophaga chungangae]MBO9152815.1 hypothetical protein [Chitinophaga chungangae]
MQLTHAYDDKVFINCPFDDGYRPLLYAMVFVIYRCGFSPITALNEDDGTDNRLHKILRCIADCRYGIHDISRIEVNSRGLPRFNMPFEAGLFLAAKHFGNREQKTKSGLVFERTKYLYQQYISDLSGIDTKAHDNDHDKIIEKVRDWLKTASRRAAIPGTGTLKREYREFERSLPRALKKLGLEEGNMTFNDFCMIVEGTIYESTKPGPAFREENQAGSYVGS